MRIPTRVLPGLMVLVALAFTACGGSSSLPSAPLNSSSPSPSVFTQWKVTQRFVSVTGPDNCWVTAQRGRLTGAVFPDLPMTVNRLNGSITLESDFFEASYRGTYKGTEFSATGINPLLGGGENCPDGPSFQMPGTSNLSGRFSADDQSLSATEVNSYRLTTGAPVTYTWDWQATRQN
jgi:hypothetical protein